MSSNDKNNKPWSASDIEKYLKGQLSSREMYDLEQAALEDPFLGDALEGIAMNDAMLDQNSGGTRIDQDLDGLRERLAARALTKNDQQPLYAINSQPAVNPAHAKKARLRLLTRRLTLAALLISLLGLGLAFFLTVRTDSRSPIAAIKKEHSTKKEPTPQTPASANAATTTTQPGADTATSKPAPQTAETKSQPDQTAAPGQAEAKVHKSIAKNDSVDLALKLTELRADKKIGALPSYLSSTGRRFDTNAFIGRQLDNSLIFRGIVLDPQDRPLAGASLYLKGVRNISTTTDQEGQFNLQLRPQDSSRRLMVAMVGYKEKAFALNVLNIDGPAGNIIRLQPHPNAFDEVVVAGYGAQRKETLAASPSPGEGRLDLLWQFASPVIGDSSYRHYLDSAKNTLGLDSSIRGREVISFEVDRNGVLTSFKIEQSLSPAHDSGLIRLVNEGSAWKLLKGKKVRAVVSLDF